jgi:hypothetical protein
VIIIIVLIKVQGTDKSETIPADETEKEVNADRD